MSNNLPPVNPPPDDNEGDFSTPEVMVPVVVESPFLLKAIHMNQKLITLVAVFLILNLALTGLSLAIIYGNQDQIYRKTKIAAVDTKEAVRYTCELVAEAAVEKTVDKVVDKALDKAIAETKQNNAQESSKAVRQLQQATQRAIREK